MKELKTKRLSITPMTDNELRAVMASEPDAHMKSAYSEMLAGCLSHPNDRLWYTNWRIALRKSGTPVGSLGFKGPPVNGAVEIGCGIDGPYRQNGYASEALKEAIHWAFSRENVYFTTAETAQDNAASQHMLEKLGFTPVGTGPEGPRFEKERPASLWLSIYMCLGTGVGVSLGNAFNNLALSLSLGSALGVALGASLDAADKKKRAAFRAARAGNDASDN